MPDSTQVNTNTKGIAQNTYDAIIIGSGISGGWAAKELCELGLKTLVLERGRNPFSLFGEVEANGSVRCDCNLHQA